MIQEVQITLTLGVDATQSKTEIESFIRDLINTHTFHSTTYNRMMFDIYPNIEIKEEEELYKTN